MIHSYNRHNSDVPGLGSVIHKVKTTKLKSLNIFVVVKTKLFVLVYQFICGIIKRLFRISCISDSNTQVWQSLSPYKYHA